MANIFGKSANSAPLKLVIALLLLAGTLVAGITYYYTPWYTRVGYQPTQPVAFSHYLHAEQLGMDCRYCHTYVNQSEHSNLPDSATCMNCHHVVKANSPLLAPVRASYESGAGVPWVVLHQTPDYVYFNHAVHVNRGVSCVECHGQVNEMEVVYHAQPLSMAFCLNCHRDPQDFIRPLDQVYNLNWQPANPDAHMEWAREAVINWSVNPPISCSGCHR